MNLDYKYFERICERGDGGHRQLFDLVILLIDQKRVLHFKIDDLIEELAVLHQDSRELTETLEHENMSLLESTALCSCKGD